MYEIKTRGYHQKWYDNLSAKLESLLEYDNAISLWIHSMMCEYHSTAIALLLNGELLEIDGPAANRLELVDKRERSIGAVLGEASKAGFWLLPKRWADIAQRDKIPIGDKSSVQYRLGLHEIKIMTPCCRYLTVGYTDLDSPIVFRPEF